MHADSERVGRGEGEGEGEPLAEGEPPPPPPPLLALAEDVRIDESEACGWDEKLVDAASDAVPQALTPPLGEGDWDRLPEPRALGEGEGDAETQRVGVPLGEGEGDAEARREAVPLDEGECDAEAQREAVPLPVADREGSPTVTEGQGEGEGELLPLPLGSGERDEAGLELFDCATEGVAVCARGLPLEDSEGGGVPSSLAVAADVGDALPHAVREGDAVEESDAVPHAVREGDALEEGDALPHALREGDALEEGDALPHALREGDAQEVAVVDCEADGEADVEGLLESGTLLEGERDAEAQREAVPLPDADNEGRCPVADGHGVEERERLPTTVEEVVLEGTVLALCDRSTVDDAVGARVPLGVSFPLREGKVDAVPGEAVALEEGDRLLSALREGDASGEEDADTEAHEVRDAECERVPLTVKEGEPLAL